MTDSRMTRIALAVAAPVLALVTAFVITSVVLILAGDDWLGVWGQILSWPSNRTMVNIVNSATVYYLSAVAVAIRFRMNLFNIGVAGQYRVASFAAAWVACEAWLPGYLNIVLALLAGMFVGAMWAGIAGLLRVTRGVSEVISTIMLNAIATAVVAYFLRKVAIRTEGSNIISTKPIAEESRIPGIPFLGGEIYGFVVVAVLVGVADWVVINRDRQSVG